MQGQPGTPQGAIALFRWDTENPAPNQEFGLLRFDAIFGTGVGQVPPGAPVASATVSVVVSGPSIPPAAIVQEAAVPWLEATETWNSFGGDPGVQTDEYRISPAYAAPTDIGLATIDVTASVDAWARGTRTNHGWVFRPQSSNDTIVRSAEYPAATERPKLAVTYGFTPTCTLDVTCSDGDACNGIETCTGGKCRAGDPPECDDGNTCTTDSCGALVGCVHADNTLSCDDGSACTTGDTCSGGVCGGAALAVPGEIEHVAWDEDKETLRWDTAAPAGPGTVHDVVRGIVAELPVGYGPGEACLAAGVAAAAASDTVAPGPGQGFWYDVRARNGCGIGTYGFETKAGVPVAERVTVICP
jgi:hypothetical protein